MNNENIENHEFGKTLNLDFRHGVNISKNVLEMIVKAINGVPSLNMRLYGDKTDIMITVEGVSKQKSKEEKQLDELFQEFLETKRVNTFFDDDIDVLKFPPPKGETIEMGEIIEIIENLPFDIDLTGLDDE